MTYICIIIHKIYDTDPMEFYGQSNINIKSSDNTMDATRNHHMTIYFTGLSIAFIMLIIAILMRQFAV